MHLPEIKYKDFLFLIDDNIMQDLLITDSENFKLLQIMGHDVSY